MILRVPGIGLTSANRIVGLRRRDCIRFEHLRQLGVVVKRAAPFITCDGLPARQWAVSAAAAKRADPSPSAFAPTTRAAAQPKVFVTDGTFDGLLTAIPCESHAGKRTPSAIEPETSRQPGLFDARVVIATDPRKADRVWRGLKTHLGARGRRRVLDAYHSGRPGVETIIARYVRDAVPAASARPPAADLAAQIEVERLSQKVRREAHRLKGFIRFQRTAAAQYLALIAPRYMTVLPLVRRHFEKRCADQSSIIYDTKRDYGLCCDGRRTPAAASGGRPAGRRAGRQRRKAVPGPVAAVFRGCQHPPAPQPQTAPESARCRAGSGATCRRSRRSEGRVPERLVPSAVGMRPGGSRCQGIDIPGLDYNYNSETSLCRTTTSSLSDFRKRSANLR